jgi:uncharacterized UBP type Zn finger protein
MENKIDINTNNNNPNPNANSNTESNNNNNNETNSNTNSEIKNTEVLQETQSQKGESISGLVDQIMVAQLMSMGYSKNVSEKSLFLNKNNFDGAMEWIYVNQSENDFEEELTIVQGKPKSNLTEEEQYAKAKELQERARKMMKERDEENERLRAIKRIEESNK